MYILFCNFPFSTKYVTNICSYRNGDTYEGYFKDGLRHGHGVLKQGKLTSNLASIYIGEWAHDKRCGYGVHEDVIKGMAYMRASSLAQSA